MASELIAAARRVVDGCRKAGKARVVFEAKCGDEWIHGESFGMFDEAALSPHAARMVRLYEQHEDRSAVDVADKSKPCTTVAEIEHAGRELLTPDSAAVAGSRHGKFARGREDLVDDDVMLDVIRAAIVEAEGEGVDLGTQELRREFAREFQRAAFETYV